MRDTRRPNLDAGLDVDPLLAEGPSKGLGRLRLHAGDDLVESFEEMHLAPHVGEHRGKLRTDRSGANHRDPTRLTCPVECLVAGDDSFTVDLVAGDRPRDGARGDDRRPCRECRRGAVAAVTSTPPSTMRPVPS